MGLDMYLTKTKRVEDLTAEQYAEINNSLPWEEKDYDKIHEDDVFNFTDLKSFSPNNQLSLEIIHSDNSKEIIKLNHTFNSQQIEWYKNGSALNLIKSNNL